MARGTAEARGDAPFVSQFKSWAGAPKTCRAVEAAGAIARAPLPPRSASQDIMSTLSPRARPSPRDLEPAHARPLGRGRRDGVSFP